jgi:hypothetical protein
MNRGGATHVPSAALSFVFPLLCVFVVVFIIFARRAIAIVVRLRLPFAATFLRFLWFTSSGIIFTSVL